MPAVSQEKTVRLQCELDLELADFREQRWVLAGLAMSDKLTSSEKEAIEGLLNLTDFISDKLVEQGLATPREVFPRDPRRRKRN